MPFHGACKLTGVDRWAQGGIVALTTPVTGAGAQLAWTQLSIVHNADTLPATPAGVACSSASEDDVVRLPDGRLMVVYRNDGPGGAWSANVPLCTQVSDTEGATWSTAKPFPIVAPPPSPATHPPPTAGTPLVFQPCESAAAKLQSWKYDGKSLRAAEKETLCVDHTDMLQLRLQACNAGLTNQSWAANTTELKVSEIRRKRRAGNERHPLRPLAFCLLNYSRLLLPPLQPAGGSFLKATGLTGCPSGSGPPAVPGCCMEVAGAGTAPGTAADIYHCAAAAGVRAPNLDFTMPSARSSGAVTQVIAAQPKNFCLTAQTWTPPEPADASMVPVRCEAAAGLTHHV